MSDSGQQMPPPPPPNLSPPPGYAAYQPTAAGSVPLLRVQKLRTALVVLLIVVAVGNALVLATVPSQVDTAEELLAGTIDDDTFNERQLPSAFAQLLVGAATIAVIVLSIIWLFRIVKNHRTLGRRGTWGPGWAIGGWFLPPLLYVIPTLLLREHWKASDPDAPVGDERWRSSGEPALVYVWFVLYSVIPVGLAIAGSSAFFRGFNPDPQDLAEGIVDTQGVTIASAIFAVLGAVAWLLVVRALTARHVALTGEIANARR